MLFKKTHDMWLQRVADTPIKYKMYDFHQIIASCHLIYPARMLRKIKRLKFGCKFNGY